jgi:4'-phosphopantetheinyl transferase EntD
MPLFYQHIIDEDTRLGIWRIEEPEAFFLEKVPVKKEVSHPYKRLQHLAGRYLLPVLQPDFPLASIEIADTRKPFLPGEKYHFSISHCGNHAAAIVSSSSRVGVDIEMVTPRMQSIKSKFLHPKELEYLREFEEMTQLHLELLCLLWSAKESVYKWHGNGQLDFSEHMQLSGPIVFRANKWFDLPFQFKKGPQADLQVEARLFDHLALSWVQTEV